MYTYFHSKYFDGDNVSYSLSREEKKPVFKTHIEIEIESKIAAIEYKLEWFEKLHLQSSDEYKSLIYEIRKLEENLFEIF